MLPSRVDRTAPTGSSSAFSAATARRDSRRRTSPSAGRGAGTDNLDARAARPTKPASSFCCRSGAGKATAARPTSKERRFETTAGRAGCSRRPSDITVFATVHAPLVHPVFAAKQFVTADHVGRGRFGLNVVCGWNQDEFDMFGVEQREHDDALRVRRRVAAGRLPHVGGRRAVRLRGRRFFTLARRRGRAQAVRRDATAHDERGRLRRRATAFGIANCDVLFRRLRIARGRDAENVRDATVARPSSARDIGVFTAGDVVCRPTQREAEEYCRYFADENADWEAIDYHMLDSRCATTTAHRMRSAEEIARCAGA